MSVYGRLLYGDVYKWTITRGRQRRKRVQPGLYAQGIRFHARWPGFPPALSTLCTIFLHRVNQVNRELPGQFILLIHVVTVRADQPDFRANDPLIRRVIPHPCADHAQR